MIDENPGESHRSAARCPRAWTILLLTSAIGLFADLWTKWYAFKHVAGFPVDIERQDVLAVPDLGMLIPHHEPVTFISSVLEFTLVLNPGAVFGIGAGQRWFFIIFTIIACVVAVALFVRWSRAQDWLAHSGFGLIIAGGLGNLYDRLIFACVRDFIHPLPGVQLPFGLSWPGGNTEVWPYVSNVADAFLIVGIVFLMIHAWRLPDGQQTPDEAPTESKPNT
ncbi:MAG: signal peptidase II [Phycisphaerales bacterium JB047]